CVSDFGMAHSDFWSEGRILIAGDSRVRRLMDNPDSVLDEKIDYAFQPGILVDELVDLVDGNLNEHHSIIILVGMIGDEIQKYVHHVSDGSSVNLFRSKECDATEKILIAVKAASDKWSSRKTGRMVMWTIPHYVDYVAYNSGKLGKFDSDESYEISLDSTPSVSIKGPGKAMRQRSRTWKSQPYVPKKIKLYSSRIPVHSRLSQPLEDETVEETFEEEPVKVKKSPRVWSWGYHNRRINAVKTAVYTQGLEEQKWAEGSLAHIIKERGFQAASESQIDTVNEASKSWMRKLMCYMNSPEPDATLVQKEMADLLPVEEDKREEDKASSSESEIN
ncbi:unnamed protein product, partial [Rotaria magnacalcarata]